MSPTWRRRQRAHRGDYDDGVGGGAEHSKSLGRRTQRRFCKGRRKRRRREERMSEGPRMRSHARGHAYPAACKRAKRVPSTLFYKMVKVAQTQSHLHPLVRLRPFLRAAPSPASTRVPAHCAWLKGSVTHALGTGGARGAGWRRLRARPCRWRPAPCTSCPASPSRSCPRQP